MLEYVYILYSILTDKYNLLYLNIYITKYSNRHICNKRKGIKEINNIHKRTFTNFTFVKFENSSKTRLFSICAKTTHI